MAIGPTAEWGIHASERVSEVARELALAGHKGVGRQKFEGNPRLADLANTGSELWLDTGDSDQIARLWSAELRAVTTNNALVNDAVQTGRLDDALIEAARRFKQAVPELSQPNLIYELGFVANARVALDLVSRFGAQVSVELHPAVADDVEGNLVFGRRYFALCPERFIIKVAMTPDGFLATKRLGEEKIPVNYTLGFSARQNLLATKLSRPRYVNVFLGRLNSVVETNKLGAPELVGERATLASQREVISAQPEKDRRTLQIAASLRNGQQVVDLAGVDVLTIPPAAVHEFLNRPVEPLRSRLKEDYPVHLRDTETERRASALWEVSDSYRAFVEAAVREAKETWTGRDLRALARGSGVHDLFREWTAEDRAEMRRHGKIPDVGRWPTDAGLDELMTMSGLEFFAAAQHELDDRLAQLIARA